LFPLVASALGAAYALSGRVDEAGPLLERAVEHAASMREIDFHAHRLTCLGEAYLLAGRLDDARALAARALDLSREHKERGWEAYALRLLGALAAQGDPQDINMAETHYRQAMAVADELGMRPLLAHCHLGLGTLYSKAGLRQRARPELSTASEQYRGMQMTFWLSQAESALAPAESY
jgi:tetratricopeptide (TPR) repeat protein